MLPKLKKLLKKSLIKAYVNGMGSNFSLESSIRLDSKVETGVIRANVVGSNINQIRQSFDLINLDLKIPIAVKVFANQKLVSLSFSSNKSNLGISASILFKKNGLLIKSENYKNVCQSQKKNCTKLQISSILAFFLIKQSKRSIVVH